MMTAFRLIALSLVTSLGLAVAQDVNDPALDDALAEASDGLAPRMGWQLVPVPPREGEPLSELDRLSLSSSGVSFGAQVYDSVGDNPLVPVSVTLRALDKITATYHDMDIPIGEEATFGPLTLLPRTCDKRPPEETPETTVFLEVFSNEADVQGARTRAQRDDTLADAENLTRDAVADGPPAVFRGWMFASSPSLNAMEHPVYDVWVIDCTMVEPSTELASENQSAE